MVEREDIYRNIGLAAAAGINRIEVYLFDLIVGHRQAAYRDARTVYADVSAEVGCVAFKPVRTVGVVYAH